MVAVAGDTVIELATAVSTVIVAVALTVLTDDEVAVIVALPVVDPPVTTPLASTEATPGAEEVQVTDSPLITSPFWSNTVGASVWVAPGVSVAEVGESVIEVTAEDPTVMVALAVTVLSDDDVAVMVAVP